MYSSLHLFFPFCSSIMFVLGALYAKRAADRGISPFTITALANLMLGFAWLVIGSMMGDRIPVSAYLPAVLIALAFVFGQVCTYLAFQWGDVSLATPVFGIKIIVVAILSAKLAEQSVGVRVWVAAVLAALGIAVIQMGPRGSLSKQLTKRRAAISVGLATLAAVALSIFDVGVQHYGREIGAVSFLAPMFVLAALFSLGLFPLGSSIRSVRAVQAEGLMLISAFLMAGQAMSITYALGKFGDATRVNIVYSLRGLWSVVLVWCLARWSTSHEVEVPRDAMIFRFIGAILLTIAVLVTLA